MTEFESILSVFVEVVVLAGIAVALGAVTIWTRRLVPRPLRGRVYQVIAPEGGGAPEQLFTALHGLLRPWHRRLIHGQPWIALELAGWQGQARFCVWIPRGEESFVDHLLRAAYSGVELRPLAARRETLGLLNY